EIVVEIKQEQATREFVGEMQACIADHGGRFKLVDTPVDVKVTVKSWDEPQDVKVLWQCRAVNCRTEPCDVKVMRPSIYGNPFKIGRDGDRSEVIRKYRELLASNPSFVARAAEELARKRIGCCCLPLECHASVLAEEVNKHAQV